MIKLLLQSEIFAWPLLILAAVVAVLSVRKILELLGKKGTGQVEPEGGPNAILFWGCISLLTGFLGHYMGIYNATQAISRAGSVPPAIVARGYGESLLPILIGMLIFMFAALVWFVLRWRYKKLVGGA